MEDILVFIVLLVVLWFSVRWISTLLFRSKTMQVIEQDLAYKLPTIGPHNAVLNEVTSSAKARKMNEYDAAIAFMISQFHILTKPHSQESKQFIRDKLAKIFHIVPKATIGMELYREFLRSDTNPDK